jgi:hypothetical protein
LQAFLNFDIVSVGARCDNEKQIRPVPMSWWLAMPTQAYLDGEICARHNRSTIAGVLSQLGEQPEESAQSASADASLKEAVRKTQKDRFDANATLVSRACRDVGQRGRSRQTR